jgi:DNA-binding transcriptional MerR regulator
MQEQPGWGSAGEWLTCRDVAGMAGVTTETVRTWGDTGKLPVTRTRSGIRLFRMADVTAFVAARVARVHRGGDGPLPEG